MNTHRCIDAIFDSPLQLNVLLPAVWQSPWWCIMMVRGSGLCMHLMQILIVSDKGFSTLDQLWVEWSTNTGQCSQQDSLDCKQARDPCCHAADTIFSASVGALAVAG